MVISRGPVARDVGRGSANLSAPESIRRSSVLTSRSSIERVLQAVTAEEDCYQGSRYTHKFGKMILIGFCMFMIV